MVGPTRPRGGDVHDRELALGRLDGQIVDQTDLATLLAGLDQQPDEVALVAAGQADPARVFVRTNRSKGAAFGDCCFAQHEKYSLFRRTETAKTQRRTGILAGGTGA